ncbi:MULTISPECIES: ABC transporter substrate-binding protein [Chromobacterium]|nr:MULTISPECIES: transporter substrate-binding domain-containing protein [Chromobacterium]
MIKPIASGCLLLLLYGLSPHACGQLPETVRICVDAEEWPPFFYFEREGTRVTQRNIGYTVDYLQAIFEQARQKYTVTRMSWIRCQAEVKSGNLDMTVDAVSSPEREQAYLLSKTYYYTTGIYFFSRARPMPKIHSQADLKTLHVCGQHGYAYQPFGLGPQDVDTTPYTLSAAMMQLKAGHCDAVLEEKEVAIGMAAIGLTNYLKHPDFGYREVPGMAGSDYHMLISRQVPYASQLLRLVDAGINDELSARLRRKDVDPILDLRQ